jgi:hypothetical protein
MNGVAGGEVGVTVSEKVDRDDEKRENYFFTNYSLQYFSYNINHSKTKRYSF